MRQRLTVDVGFAHHHTANWGQSQPDSQVTTASEARALCAHMLLFKGVPIPGLEIHCKTHLQIPLCEFTYLPKCICNPQITATLL